MKSIAYKHETKKKKFPDATFAAASRENAYMPIRHIHEGGMAKVYKLEKDLAKEEAYRAAKSVDTAKEALKAAREKAREKRL